MASAVAGEHRAVGREGPARLTEGHRRRPGRAQRQALTRSQCEPAHRVAQVLAGAGRAPVGSLVLATADRALGAGLAGRGCRLARLARLARRQTAVVEARACRAGSPASHQPQSPPAGMAGRQTPQGPPSARHSSPAPHWPGPEAAGALAQGPWRRLAGDQPAPEEEVRGSSGRPGPGRRPDARRPTRPEPGVRKSRRQPSSRRARQNVGRAVLDGEPVGRAGLASRSQYARA